MIDRRSAGILVHPTSLPGPYGIGDIGPAAYEFLDFLKITGAGLWQILPLGPTGYGNSPYAELSSFAGNPLLISPDLLREEGLLLDSDLADIPGFPLERVDFDLLIPWKEDLLRRAAGRFSKAPEAVRDDFKRFLDTESWWLEDYVLYDGLRRHFLRGEAGPEPWEADIRLRKAAAVKKWRSILKDQLETGRIIQYLFFRQWRRLKSYAAECGVEIIGDVPIFVAPDSADVWTWPDNFLLKQDGKPEAVAGVPPDYFSETGQMWGNPLYSWEYMKSDDYSWWKRRIDAVLRRVDWIRIDHFRGFQAYWRIPGDAETAMEGEWIEAPGKEFFANLLASRGDLPVIAEDLGVITEEVDNLRREFSFPGMRVLQFAFEFDKDGRFNGDHQFLPHNYEANTVVYTGTHDNDTTAGWYSSCDDTVKDVIRRYLARDDHDIVWDFIRLALSSNAGFALIPLQDILVLGTEHRMNTPSTVGPANWSFRFRKEQLTSIAAERLKDMLELYGRARTIREGSGGLV